MPHLLSTTLATNEDVALRAMFIARKQVFIDLLKWDLPILEGRYEVDQFDDEHARYLILLDKAGDHLGSARLLPTTTPHILGSLFPELCDCPPPSDAATYEVTRFCLDRSLRATERRAVRDRLVTALVSYALETGIERYTAVAEMGWLQQVLGFGWDCVTLGVPITHRSGTISAIEIRIAKDTPERLAETGIWSLTPNNFASPLPRAAAKG